MEENPPGRYFTTVALPVPTSAKKVQAGKRQAVANARAATFRGVDVRSFMRLETLRGFQKQPFSSSWVPLCAAF